MIQEHETRFNNMPMLAFRIPIMFMSVGKCSDMGYTMGRKIGPKG